MSGRAALEALVASPNTLGVSSEHVAELVEGLRGVLRSRAGADGGDPETVRPKEEFAMGKLVLFALLVPASSPS